MSWRIVTHDLEAQPIFTLLEGRYDIPLIEAEYELEAISADQDVRFKTRLARRGPAGA